MRAGESTIASEYDLQKIRGENRLIALWRLMTGFRRAYLLANICLGVAALMKTGTYLLLKQFIDGLTGSAGLSVGLPIFALGFVALAVSEGAFSYVSGRLAARTAEGIAFRLRTYFYDHIQRLSFAYHSQSKTGDVIARATSDIDALRRYFAEQAIGVGRVALLFTVNLAALFVLESRLAWASIAVIPLILGVSILFFRRATHVYEGYQAQQSTLSSTLQENLTGVRVVKAFARQAYEMDKFERDNWSKYEHGKRFMTLHALFWPLSSILLGAQLLGGYYYGAVLAIQGEITLGSYLAYAGILVWLIFPMRHLGRLIVQMSTGMVSLGRIMEVISEDQESLDAGDYEPDDGVRGDIRFEGVAFAYPDDQAMALRDITLHCKPGQVVALLGATGSGKTSLVHLLPRFYEYTGGRIALDGVDLRQYSKRFLRRNIGIVEQEPFLFSKSIRENIAYGALREVSQAEIESAARAAAIHDVIMQFPNGYDTLVGERGVTLSGGQKQRIAIARTILRAPRILILDDSTSSVDTVTEALIRGALQRLMVGRTTFVIAHRIQSVKNADLILVLENGGIIQRGRHEELIEMPGPYREIFEVQAQIEVEVERESIGG
jgi:ATP-binding cassette subfamily B protein